MQTTNKTKHLTEAAMMIALSTVLSLFTLFKMPFGGEVTLGCMVPILFYSFRYPGKPALFMSFTCGILQLMLGSANVAYGKTAFHYIAIMLLDYILAYGILGFAGLYKSKKTFAMLLSSVSVILLRYIFHLVSGFLIWESLFGLPEGFTGAYWTYNLAYNSFVLIDGAIAVFLLFVLSRFFANKKH